MNDEPDDPILEAQIEAEVARALGPGVGVLPKEVLASLRAGLLARGMYDMPPWREDVSGGALGGEE